MSEAAATTGEIIEEGEYEEIKRPTPTVAALAVREQGDSLVRPAAGIGAIEQAFRDYQELTTKLLTDDDYQPIRQWNSETRKQETRLFPKRSAWRKLAVAFGVTFEIVTKERDRDEKGRTVSADFVVRATAPNGRFADGWGNADAFERCCQQGCRKRHTHCAADCDGRRHFSKPEHDIPATAETRAKNRAAADLFGMGAVSAEEVEAQPEGAAAGGNGGAAGAAEDGPKPATEAQVTWFRNAIDNALAVSQDPAWTSEAVLAGVRKQIRANVTRFEDMTMAEIERVVAAIREHAGVAVDPFVEPEPEKPKRKRASRAKAKPKDEKPAEPAAAEPTE